MTPERWLEIKRAFEALLEMESAARQDRLEKMRWSAPELHREVSTLLEAHAHSDSFLERGAVRSGPAAAAEEPILPPGTRLGTYEVTGFVGAGGMGRVYRARDPRLGREVAVKVLREDLGGAGGLVRFEREARAVAALAHPNVLAIHDTGHDGGRFFLVTELLEGQPLRTLLAGGALPPRKARGYALEIARGLAAAHDKGIVHRDLKPENVFITADGRVKLLDFGLARPVGPASEIWRSGSASVKGVLGTAGYMSPEQARGEPADTRSDIFSLGVVFHEMLTGKRPFDRGSAVESLHDLLHGDPPRLDDGVPAPVARVVQRCLEKQPGERFQSAHDLAFAIEAVSSIPSGPIPAQPARFRRRWALAVPALVALGAAAGWWLRALDRRLPPPTVRPLTYSGHDSAPAVSPDGRTVAFVSDRDGVPRIWLKRLAGGEEVALTNGPDDAPRFSPDGASLIFTRGSALAGGQTALYRVPVLGGEPRKIVDDASEGDWSPDGRSVAFIRWHRIEGLGQTRPRLFVLELAGGEPREVALLENRVRVRPRWSPDGRAIAVTGFVQQPGVPQSIVLVHPDGRPAQTIRAPGHVGLLSSVAWAGDDAIVFSQAESVSGNIASPARIFRQRISSGNATMLLSTPTSSHSVDIAEAGTLVFDSRSPRQNLRELGTRDPAGPGRSLTSGLASDRQPVYTPDGEWVAFSSNRAGNLDLWALSPKTGAVRRLTDHAAEDWDPAFTPDGQSLLWSSNREGHFEVWTARADGSGPRRVTDDGLDAENPTSGGDGSWIVYGSGNPEKAGVWKIRPDGTQAARLVPGAILPELSPDGRYVLYQFNRGPNLSVIGVARLDDGQPAGFEIRIDVHNVANPLAGRARWMPGGRSIAFVGQDARGVNGIFVQDFVPGADTGTTRRAVGGFDEIALAESFTVSPDGQRMVVAAWEQSVSLMIAAPVQGVARPHAATSSR